jgi:hypothetical protein
LGVLKPCQYSCFLGYVFNYSDIYFFRYIYNTIQDNKCQGGTNFYMEKLWKQETVLWDDRRKLKEDKK